jgi:hypothetical protein
MIPLPTVDVLDSITIAVPCRVPWEDMRGDHQTRFCDKCNQNVHDLSELTTAEAIQLVSDGKTVPCLRLFRRPDGRVMTADCMTKRERVWKWLNRRSARAAAVFAAIAFGCDKPTPIVGDVCPPREELPLAPPPHIPAAKLTLAPAPHEPTRSQRNEGSGSAAPVPAGNNSATEAER